MRSSVFARLIAPAALVTALSACGGGGGGSNTALPLAPSSGSGVTTSLQSGRHAYGLQFADPAVLATLRQLRSTESVVTLPAAADLTAKMPPVGDQGQEGSCVAWATAYAMRGYEARFDVWSAIAPSDPSAQHNFSPAFVYNQINHGVDGGSVIPDALRLLQNTGAATLADMPYVAGSYRNQPSAAAFSDAKNFKLSSWGYITPSDLTTIKSQLAKNIPIIIGFQVYQNFEYLRAGGIYNTTSGGLLGGHAVTLTGYNDATQTFSLQNQWGTYWGDAGRSRIGYTMFSNGVVVEAYSAIDDHGAPAVGPAPSPIASASASPQPTVKPSATPAPTPTPTAKPTATPAPTPTATPAALSLAINSGSTTAIGSPGAANYFASDEDFVGGTARTLGTQYPGKITSDGAGAPAGVYRALRSGPAFLYVLPNLGANRAVTVRLHFIEPDAVNVGARVFDIIANGQFLRTALDVRVAAGGVNTTYDFDAHATTDITGTLVVSFTSRTQLPAILSGIEVR